MRVVLGASCVLVAAAAIFAVLPVHAGVESGAAGKLSYNLEWRLIHAGTAVIDLSTAKDTVKLDSAGLVSTLYKVDDLYTENFDESTCTTSSVLDGQEGHRHRRLEATFDRKTNHAFFVERDLLRDAVMHSGQIEIPNCVHNVLGGIHVLRGMNLQPGQSAQIPLSDGRNAAMVKVDAQEREDLTTSAGAFHTIRYEVNIMNGVIYARKGRVFVWVSDDAKRLPVQILLRLAFPLGSLTLQLEKGSIS